MWGMCVLGVLLPWPMVDSALRGFGSDSSYDPLQQYWLRMASAVFSFLGAIFVMFGLQPRKYASIIPLFGYFMAIEGLILLFYGFQLGLPWFPFAVDGIACLFLGAGILRLAKAAHCPPEPLVPDSNH